MQNIGDLVFGFRGDAKPLEKDAKAAGLKAGETAGQSFDKSFGGRMGKLKSDLKSGGGIPGALMGGAGLGLGLGAFGAITSGLSMVTDFLGDAGAAASDLAETQSKLSAVFPVQATAMREWASHAAQSMGISTQAALEAAGTFGNFLQAMGQTEPVAAEMSKTMVQLAADLGSFNNANPEDVLLALRSGLSGETEPLRQFGVDISDAAVQTELLAQGLVKVKGQFTQTQKIQGRYNLIMKQTVRAQGDVGKTANGTANATKRAAAQMVDMKGKVGELVNNVQNLAVSLAGAGTMALVSAIDAVGEAWNNLMRAIDPQRAFEQDVDDAIRAQGQALNLNVEALIAYSNQQREFAKNAKAAVTDQNVLTFQLDRYATYLEAAGITGQEYTDSLKAYRDELTGATDATEGANEALTENEKILEAAKVMIDAFVAAGMPVPPMLTEIGETAGDVVPEIKKIAPAVKATTFQMLQTMTDAKEPWRDAWRNLAMWAKDPFRKGAFEDWLQDRAKAATRKARKAAEDGKPGVARRWREIAKAMRSPVTAALVALGQDVDVAIAKVREIQRLGKRVDKLAVVVTGAGLGNYKDTRETYGPKRASGGPVSRGMPYTVGERGPETYVPDQDGTIIPNGAGKLDIYVHDPDGGLARAGIGTSALGASIATATQAQRRWRS